MAIRKDVLRSNEGIFLMENDRYLTAQEAANELGISLDTLYAYVSRKMLHSEASDGPKRSRKYSLEEIQRLKRQKAEYRHRDKVAAGTIQAGTPVMESAITMITDDGFYYRGHNALTLATTQSVEQVAALIWTDDNTAGRSLFSHMPLESLLKQYQKIRPQIKGLTPLEAFQ